MAVIFFFYLVDLEPMNKNKVFPTYQAFHSLNLVENKNAVSDRKNLQKYLIFKNIFFSMAMVSSKQIKNKKLNLFRLFLVCFTKPPNFFSRFVMVNFG
jgi:hypothetical protein